MSGSNYEVYASKQPAKPSSQYWHQRRRIANQLRRLQEGLQTSALNEASLDAIENGLEQQLNCLSETPKLEGRSAWLKEGSYGDYAVLHSEVTPVVGLSNPISPPLTIWIEDDEAFATVSFGWVYEGAAEIAHGGFVAAVFDDFLGSAQIISGKSGFTGTLKVRYHQHIPLNQQLLLRARVKKVAGRKIVITGKMMLDEQLLASAEGLFVMPKDPKMSI